MSIISATTTLDEQEVALGMGKRLPPSNAATQAKEIFWSATNKFVDICRMGLNMRGKKGTLSIGLFPSTLTDKPDRQ